MDTTVLIAVETLILFLFFVPQAVEPKFYLFRFFFPLFLPCAESYVYMFIGYEKWLKTPDPPLVTAPASSWYHVIPFLTF